MRARVGDKSAQLELGGRFETGRGVGVDRAISRMLYTAAANDSGGPVPVWTPRIGKVSGHIAFYSSGPRVPGLPAARARLKSLENRDGHPRRSRK